MIMSLFIIEIIEVVIGWIFFFPKIFFEVMMINTFNIVFIYICAKWLPL